MMSDHEEQDDIIFLVLCFTVSSLGLQNNSAKFFKWKILNFIAINSNF